MPTIFSRSRSRFARRLSSVRRPVGPRRWRAVSGLISATALISCSDGPTGPSKRLPFEANASVRWNAVARGLVIKYRTDPPLASRVYALVSVAQDRAVRAISANGAPVGAGTRRPLDRAAAVSASRVMLTYAYPNEASALDSIARGDLADPLWSADTAASVAAGDSIGQSVARELIAEAESDGWNAVWTDSVPGEPGLWYSSATPRQPPLRPLWGSVRPWLIRAGDEFRPAPPPASVSAEFQSALAEVRRFSDTRTPRQLDIAKYWGDGAGTYTPPGHWNEIAANMIIWYNLSERDAARVLALLNTAVMDAGIAVWDAKYVFWCIRPSQIDPAITTPVGLPNFPAYPSGHSGFSGAAADVLGYLFPAERSRLTAMADEAGMSRLYGGIHYRFDNDVGLRMGRSVAAVAIARDRTQRGGGKTFYNLAAP